MLRPLRFSPRLPIRPLRWNSTASPASPPLMGKIRTDLKVAMRAKDKDRLNVLRALISETNNSVRTSSPIQTDLQLLSLIRKRAANAKEASKQFAEAERPDLQENEEKQIAILDEYAGQVETMSLDDVKQIISQEIAKQQEGGSKTNVGLVLKSLFAPGGALDGKPAERSEVARLAKELVAAA